MENGAISNMILQNAMILQGQPKWTFNKNTCNTYEMFVTHFRNEEGYLLPAWPILRVVEQDDAMTQLFSTAILWHAVRETVRIGNEVNANMTLSLNLLPRFAESEFFVEQVRSCLEETQIQSKHLQFELSELQDINDQGVENLNTVHDELGISLVMGNFGTRSTNIPLLYKIHFDLIELDKSFAARIPQDDMACRAVIAIQHMADTLNLKVCAKGIANQDQFEFFEEIGIFKGQGPLIGSVMSLEELKDYLKRYGVKKGHA